ncbi:hypothetical protein AMJ52_01575 [candidate division TA06 bacterium DG_78]|uniref:Putative membrane protein insertion efficiency factor n=1 Tax=candidate division TA06 bacterium DG_78 TaxID=1703772 RepID=A0A0S7YHE5_UNCT6|nr:MAG: hypothetical protein AMJ52_01575 [candidate division TA06 bacterium DG_78]
MKAIAIAIVKAYQCILGPLFPRVCRFEPTCSTYAIEAIDRFGVVKGGLLSVWRIVRCNPFCVGGWDPVPSSRTIVNKVEHE